MTLPRNTTSSAIAALLVLSAGVSAAEPVEAFLKELRGRGYHDMAVEYLERLLDHPPASEKAKRQYSLELGSELLETARTQADVAVRDQIIERALDKLKGFVAGNPNDSLALTAQAKIAETLLERGRVLAARANLSRDKMALRTQARTMLQEATQYFEAVEKGRLAEFNELAPSADTAARNKLGGAILETRLKIADATSDLAKTFDADSPEAKQALKKGLDRYKQLYDRYHSDGFVAAYVARVREAENYLELGNAEEALSRLDDVLGLDARNEVLRDLVLTPAYVAALKSWHRKATYGEAIDKAEAYAASPSASENKRADWLEMQYWLALAYQKQAETLKAGDPQRTKLESQARNLAGQVVKQKSDVQNDARLLLGKVGSATQAEEAGARTFDEALEKATAAIQAVTTAKLAADAGPPSAEAGTASAEQLTKPLNDALSAAYRAVQGALALADDKTDLARLNTARFYLCYLHWEYAQAESAKNSSSSHYLDAAVLGDYLARRFPDHVNARQAMAIALAAYQKIRQDEAASAQQAAQRAGQTSDELRATVDSAVGTWSTKVAELAEYALARWPDTDEAATAIAVLASGAVERQDFDTALALIEKLKPETARRADTELRIGRAIWAQYVRAKKDNEQQASQTPGQQDDSNTTSTLNGSNNTHSGPVKRNLPGIPDRKTLAEWATHAQTLLEKGLGAAKKNDDVDRQFVLGQWALVQSYVNTGQPQKAIAWLDEDKIGLLALVNDKHEAAEIEGLMFDVYRLALRAYIAAKPQQLDKALATMDALEKITGDNVTGREMLTTVYLAMGRDLQQEIKELVAAGDTTEVAALSTAFEAFLKRLAGRESGNNFNSLFWVADTYVELGSSLAQAPANSSAEIEPSQRSREYHKRAVAAFEAILQRDQADGQFMPDRYLPLVEMKLAKSYRGAGEYHKALALLARFLKDKPNVLEVQFEAAYAYQELAASDPKKHSQYFRRAILGGDSDESRNIWGWNALAQKIRAHGERLRQAGNSDTAKQVEDYRQRYQEARYNSVYCTFALATQETNAAERNRLLKVAKQGIWSVYAIVDSELGGGQWKTRNERLLKDIQRALGESEIGLKQFEQKRQSQTAAAK